MKKVVFMLFLCIGVTAVQAQQQATDELVRFTSPMSITEQPYSYNDGDKFEVLVLNHADSTFYYEIVINGIVTFRQHDCPGRLKGIGFPTKSSAQKVGERVVMKLKRPVAPPIVTAAEMEMYNLK